MGLATKVYTGSGDAVADGQGKIEHQTGGSRRYFNFTSGPTLALLCAFHAGFCVCVCWRRRGWGRLVAICLLYQLLRLWWWAWRSQGSAGAVRLKRPLWGWSTTVLLSDAARVWAIQKEPVVGDGYAPYYFSCGHTSILGSAGEAWRHHRREIHPWVAAVGTRIVELAQVTPISAPPTFDVRLIDWVGPYYASISAKAMGIPDVVLPVRLTSWRVAFWLLLTLLTGDIWRWLGSAAFRWTRYDRSLREAIGTSCDAHLVRLRSVFGEDDVVGHVCAVALGSVLPEASITCDILHELAANPPLQSAVRSWVAGASLADEDRFGAFILDRCQRYPYFTFGKVRRFGAGEDAHVDFMVDHRACRTPWGVGRRRCPGALTGQRTIGIVCTQILRRYTLTQREASSLPAMFLGLHHVAEWKARIRVEALPIATATAVS